MPEARGNCPTYAEVAQAAGVANPKTGQGLKPYLDAVGEFCRRRGVPDLAVMVVTAASRRSGDPMPSDAAFDAQGRYGLAKLSRQGVRDEQMRARRFDWNAQPWVR